MALDLVSVGPQNDFSYSVFGWDVTAQPPGPTGDGQFAAPPDPVLLDTANSTQIPLETISFTTSSPSNGTYLSYASGSDHFTYADIAGGCWIFELQGSFANFTVELASPTAVNLVLTIAAAGLDKTAKAVFSISVNKKQYVPSYTDTDGAWHPAIFALPSELFQAGSNIIEVRLSDESPYQLWLQAVSVSTADVPVNSYYVWTQVASGLVPSGDTPQVSISCQTGDVTSDTDSQSFSNAVGVEGGFSLGGLSIKLSDVFTTQTSSTHTIAITDLVTITQTINLPTAGAGNTLTYQVWQLGIQFNAAGNQLVQNQNLIVVTQYPASS